MRKVAFLLILLISLYLPIFPSVIIANRGLFHCVIIPTRALYFLGIMSFNETNNITAPVLISPENACIAEEHQPITFKWTNISEAKNYTLQIDMSRHFNTSYLIEVAGLNTTEYTLKSGLSFGLWYWCVCAIFEDGQKICSEIRNIIVIPPAPILIHPKNSCTIEEYHPIIFRWTDVNGVKNYTLQIDTTKYFNSSELIEIRGINGTEYTLGGGLSFGLWYWRVCAIFEDGQVAYSEIRCIKVIPEREIPQPSSFWEDLIFGWGIAISILIYFLASLWISDYFGRRARRCEMRQNEKYLP
ncbi:MAG: hypothetical protein J7L07_07730 [Candidatus Odinarchaeota archaeon]|nr:hypothetical protein [Candidatus Odinarchaeota archaeon]